MRFEYPIEGDPALGHEVGDPWESTSSAPRKECKRVNCILEYGFLKRIVGDESVVFLYFVRSVVISSGSWI